MFKLLLLLSVSVGFVVLAALVIDVLVDGGARLSLGLHHQLPLAHLTREHRHRSRRWSERST